MRQGGEPQGVQIVRQGEPTPYHCNFNRLYIAFPARISAYWALILFMVQMFIYGYFEQQEKEHDNASEE